MKIEPPDLVIRQGETRDAARLAELAARLFRQAYEDQMPAGDLELYIAEDFSAARQSDELGDPGITSLLVEAGSELAGYAQLRRKSIPLDGDSDIALELWRIYLDRGFRGAGIGRRNRARHGCRANLAGSLGTKPDRAGILSA